MTPPLHHELRELVFFCAHTDERFAVLFVRAPGGLYRIKGMARETGLADRFFVDAARHAVENDIEGVTLRSPRAESFALSEFDTTGWSCLCGCGDFLHCSACDSLVCDGTAFTDLHGQAWHHCRPGCGASGRIIKTDITARGRSTALRHASPLALPPTRDRNPRPALPAPARPLLPRR